MEGEFNNLVSNNTNITFSTSVDNTATSDELSASPLYQEKMGTNYSRAKKISRALTLTGIAVVAVSTGSILTNIYITNPPSVVESTFVAEVTEHTFHYEFEVKNPRNYRVYSLFLVNSEEVINFECSIETTYKGQYDKLEDGDKCEFYIRFTNQVDYTRTIKSYKFNVGGNK